MSNLKYKKQIYIFLTILWICVIFSFSLQSGEDSSQISSGFGAWLINHVLSVFSDMFESMSVEQMDSFHFFIRKCAHFTEFFILGVLMLKTLLQTKVVRKVGIGLSLCVLVAAMDETLQRFVAGRSGQVSDVILDSFGSLAGICICVICIRAIRKYHQ